MHTSVLQRRQKSAFVRRGMDWRRRSTRNGFVQLGKYGRLQPIVIVAHVMLSGRGANPGRPHPKLIAADRRPARPAELYSNLHSGNTIADDVKPGRVPCYLTAAKEGATLRARIHARDRDCRADVIASEIN